MDLFDYIPPDQPTGKPLADRMRPRTLEDFMGQEHILGEGRLLRRLLEKGDIPSMILWGPSGVGKTTLGWLMGRYMKLPFITLSAVSIGIKEVKEVIRKSKFHKIILFIDEFHRFNKLQQDTFLPHVENGDITLIGATTENPSFEIIAPLLSRMRVLTLNPLTKDDVTAILRRTLKDDQELKTASLWIEEDVISEIAALSNGDARRALNLLELCYIMVRETGEKKEGITHAIVKEAYQKNIAVYDKKGEMHYDLISALHKSMRGSDPDAALYWLTRMIEGGEDPLYILRRMVRFASEDVGNADPAALTLTVSAMEAFKFIGPPEGLLALAQACIYLSLCEKSNAVYVAYGAVRSDMKTLSEYPVPMHIRNAPTKLMKELGYGHDYLYPHDFEDAIVKQDYLPEELRGRQYYHPTDRGYEKQLKVFLEKARRMFRGD
ncbi:MAG: replication-associated recombination protein A [Syntrophobacterales bacterium]|jgi:putative ATPase|nr:replication-associated recombination protein A [Syntrophobacterales bacterium]